MFFYGFEMVFVELRYKKKNMVVFFLMVFFVGGFLGCGWGGKRLLV